jgi:hypothetical protein
LTSVDRPAIGRIGQAEIPFCGIDDLFGLVPGDHLKLVVQRHAGHLDHRFVDGLADHARTLGRRSLVQINSDQRHDFVPFNDAGSTTAPAFATRGAAPAYLTAAQKRVPA